MTHLLISSLSWSLTLQGATSLVFCVLGVYLPFRAGVLNVGAEGVMLISCFAAVLGEARSGNVWIGVACAVGSAALANALIAVLAVTWNANPFVVGIGMNFLALGGTSVAAVALYGVAGTISVPDLQPLPVWNGFMSEDLGWAGQVLGGQTPLFWLCVLTAVVMAWWLGNTRTGLAVRAVGSRPDIVEARGLSAARLRWLTLLAGGILIGLGGSQLALNLAPQFSYDMTNGLGFVALALVFVAGLRPWLLLPLCLVYSYVQGAGSNLQTVGLPSEISGFLPYVAVLALLVLPKVFRLVTGPRPEAILSSVLIDK